MADNPSKNMKCKKSVKQDRTPSDYVHYPFIHLSSQQRSKVSKKVGWFSQNHRTANPARAEPHIIWQRPLFSLPPFPSFPARSPHSFFNTRDLLLTMHLLMFRNVGITETPTNCFLNILRSCRKKFRASRLKDSTTTRL